MRKRRPLSVGTIVTLIMTAVVMCGCLFLLSRMRDSSSDTRISASTLISAFDEVISHKNAGMNATVTPAPTIKTTVVTIAPAVSSSPPIQQNESTAQNAEQTPAPTATTPPSYTLKLTVSGMVNIRTGISSVVLSDDKKSFQLNDVFSSLTPYIHADVNLAPLEGLLNGTTEKYSNIQYPGESAAALSAAGFDTLLLNNEHVLDYGLDGLNKTVSAAKTAGLSCAGVSAQGAKEKIFSFNGMKVALLAYLDALSSRGKENVKDASGVVTLYELSQVEKDIAAAKEAGASLVIVCLHWGKESAESVTNSQKEAAKKIAAAGADIILGVNPSTVLPMEMIETLQDGGRVRKTLAVYSLGTLLTDSRASRSIVSGLLLHIKVTVSPQLQQVTFDSIEYTPTYIWNQKINGKTIYKVLCSADTAPDEMNADQKKNMGNALKYIDKVLENGPATRR